MFTLVRKPQTLPSRSRGPSLAPSALQASLAGVCSSLLFRRSYQLTRVFPAINVSLAFCMGTDLDSIVNNSIGQPMATIFFNSFGQKGTLGLWAIVVIVQYMMGTSMLLASSRQVFAFSRDGALPFSGILYRMNSYTKTPVNTVWFSAFLATLLGLLVFAGDQAINAVFAISVVASYIAYAIPIVARFVFKNDFKPGPFNLGAFVRFPLI